MNIQPIKIEKCAACGKHDTEGFVVASAFGAHSNAVCLSCIEEGREPYQAIVDYISSAGHWPEDINEGYQQRVRRQLRLHKKPEEVFKFDVDRAIAEEKAFILNYCIDRDKKEGQLPL